jgi:hypothetical protein
VEFCCLADDDAGELHAELGELVQHRDVVRGGGGWPCFGAGGNELQGLRSGGGVRNETRT